MSELNNILEQLDSEQSNTEITSIEQALLQMGQIEEETNDDDSEILIEEYHKTLTLFLPLQDVSGMEKSYLIAKSAYLRICKVGDKDEIIFVRQMFHIMEIILHFFKSTALFTDERKNKALEEIIIAEKTCFIALNDFKNNEKNIEQIIDEDEDIATLFSSIKFLLYFYTILVNVFKEEICNAIQIDEGKYVNQILSYRQAANLLEQIKKNYKFSEDEKELIIPMLSYADRMAEQYEKQAEKIEKANKSIKFMPPIDNQVFIVHGHNTSILQELRQILRDYNIEPVILKEMPDSGKTLIEKFENYARLSGFAFVIITPDDFVENNGKKYFQGRPNVLFELGWFCGRFGRDRIRILRKKSTEIPSDLSGILTIDFSENLEEVFRKIGKELEDSGIINKQKN